jgi:hypothetical protein
MASTGPISERYPHANGRAQRRPAGWLAQVETRAGMSIGRTDNISLTGLLLRTRETFAPGTEVIVRFHLPPGPSGPLVESLARVVRAEEGAWMGMRFLELHDANRQRLEEYFRQGEPN